MDELVAAREAAAARGDQTTTFRVGDALALPFPDDSFDVVHAHQVLQHLTDPVTALREMRRVCRPGGWVAARDADYAAMSWYPELPELELWRSTYRAVARANGAEPDAGRRMRAWGREAGLPQAQISSSVWTYATPEATRWWGIGQAERYGGEVFAEQALKLGPPLMTWQRSPRVGVTGRHTPTLGSSSSTGNFSRAPERF